MYFILKGVVRGNEGKVASSSLGYHTLLGGPSRKSLGEVSNAQFLCETI